MFTAIVYILDANVGWGWGYGTSAVLNAISFALFVIGKWCYRDKRARGSPLASLAYVMVSTAQSKV
ncbi:NRT1-PTR FAMILY 2-3 protein [Nymphaea thermarum]|nr:NRT1-PTR FAMILY 2-3 protein [Nymphaea thermarum]